jgi:hypothetical protein
MNGYDWKITLADGTVEYMVAGHEEEVWEEYGNEAISVECVGMVVDGVSL